MPTIFLWTTEAKDAARRLEAAMETFEKATEKQRLADIHLHRLVARMRHAFDESVHRLRRE
jgi:hypothetical protein